MEETLKRRFSLFEEDDTVKEEVLIVFYIVLFSLSSLSAIWCFIRGKEGESPFGCFVMTLIGIFLYCFYIPMARMLYKQEKCRVKAVLAAILIIPVFLGFPPLAGIYLAKESAGLQEWIFGMDKALFRVYVYSVSTILACSIPETESKATKWIFGPLFIFLAEVFPFLVGVHLFLHGETLYVSLVEIGKACLGSLFVYMFASGIFLLGEGIQEGISSWSDLFHKEYYEDQIRGGPNFNWIALIVGTLVTLIGGLCTGVYYFRFLRLLGFPFAGEIVQWILWVIAFIPHIFFALLFTVPYIIALIYALVLKICGK